MSNMPTGEHLSAICYAAVRTTYFPATSDKSAPATIIAQDGNGRESRFTNVDLSLGMVARHFQALQNHYPSHPVTDFVPGYLSPGIVTDGPEPEGQTLVWVAQ